MPAQSNKLANWKMAQLKNWNVNEQMNEIEHWTLFKIDEMKKSHM